MAVRLRELCEKQPLLTYAEMAADISHEFRVALTRGAIGGKIARMGLPERRRGRGEAPVILPESPRKPKPVPAPKLPGLSLFDLTYGACRWPILELPTHEYRFCGAQKLPEGPYCAEHAKRAFQPQRRS